MEVVVISVVPVHDSAHFFHLVEEGRSGKRGDDVEAEVVHIFPEEIQKFLAVFFRLLPVADEQGCHDHQFMFLQKLHRLSGLLHGMAFPDILEDIVLMIFETHHELVDARLPETVQKVFVPDDQVGPGLEPETLTGLSFEHLLDETLCPVHG